VELQKSFSMIPNSNVGSQLLNFCVGVGVSGHDTSKFSHISKNAQANFTSFDTNVITEGHRVKWSFMKNRPKTDITGVKIA